ncbi:MAG: MmgE/PrpD family protein [Chloroflexi bacterium]|nr:MmgE/PrpD family protein [Chloroflexota bacterium]
MPDPPGPTARLCEWACATRYADLPAPVREEAQTLLLDSVGGMIASARLPTCLPVVEMVRSQGDHGGCSIVGHPLRTSVTLAALANGTISHGDQIEATGQRGAGHFGSVPVPVAITVAQYVHASGKDFLRALALGCEVTARVNSLLAEVLGTAQRKFTEVIGGTLGGAVAAGLLLDLSPQQLEHALGLAGTHASGLSAGTGAMGGDHTHQSKSLQRGMAAQTGVIAALLAQKDCHGPLEILATDNGFFDVFAGYAGLGKRVTEGLGETYLMREVFYRRFSVAGPGQAPLYAFSQLLKQESLKAEDISLVEVSLSRDGYLAVANMRHASMYLPTALSLAVVFGEVGFQHFHDARYYDDPRVKAFEERVRPFPRPGKGSPGSRLQMQMRVFTRDGRVLTTDMRYPLMNREELQQKFHALVGLRASQERVLELERKLKSIESMEDVAPFIAELELAS